MKITAAKLSLFILSVDGVTLLCGRREATGFDVGNHKDYRGLMRVSEGCSQLGRQRFYSLFQRLFAGVLLGFYAAGLDLNVMNIY